MEQRHALGQADGHSLVATDHRQTVQQGRLYSSTGFDLLSFTILSAIRRIACSDAAAFPNQCLLDSSHFSHGN